MCVLNLIVTSVVTLSLSLSSIENASTCCVAPAETKVVKSDASIALGRLKALSGSWVQVDDDGNATDQVVLTYRVTAGGSAVLETVFPGAEMEMVTLYHLDGDDLVLTHYCMLGNQPHMKSESITKDTIVFVCTGEGLAKESETHMHQATFNLLSHDRLKTEWLLHDNSEVIETAGFEVVRQKSSQ
ncbi:MAG: hypothetical protein O7G85_04550 [Planctomycetota bacterium]|nr:hypothetical protein [Planctomycetota bacterium]